MRSRIASRMAESKQQVPHFYLQTEVVVDGVNRRLAELNQNPDLPRTTMTVALVRACVAALKEHPQFNRVWTADGLMEVEDINVGVAIALDDGLLAPALLQADRLDVAATTVALRELVERTRLQRLRPDEMTDATFTLSNLGMFPVTAFTAIVTPPQVAILATARPTERLVTGDKGPVARSVMTATLSSDHRAVDGIDAARFLETFKHAIEAPEELLPASVTEKEATQ